MLVQSSIHGFGLPAPPVANQIREWLASINERHHDEVWAGDAGALELLAFASVSVNDVDTVLIFVADHEGFLVRCFWLFVDDAGTQPSDIVFNEAHNCDSSEKLRHFQEATLQLQTGFLGIQIVVACRLA